MKIIKGKKRPLSILKSSLEGRWYRIILVLDITLECKKKNLEKVFLVYLKDKKKNMLVEIIDGYESKNSGALHLFYRIDQLKSQVNNVGSCFPDWAKGFGLTSQKLYEIIMTNVPLS